MDIKKKEKEIWEKNIKNKKNTKKVKKISGEDIEKIRGALKRAQVNKARAFYDEARNCIIEWLAIDKYNHELNIELGEIYELEDKNKNAEYIYRDLLKIHPDNIEILKKLWNVCMLQWKVEKAGKIYKKIFNKKRDDIDVVWMLSEIFFELKNFKKCLSFTKLFLKDKPKDVEKLWMKWYCLEKEWEIDIAIKCYERILEIQPYNKEMKDRIFSLRNKI